MKGSTFICALLALCLVLPVLSQGTGDRDGAFLVFSRRLSADLVQGLNVSVTYEVHNVGKGEAIAVTLKDNAFPQSRFRVLNGTFKKVWPSIAAGASEFLEVTVMPKRAGELYVNPPALMYKDGEAARISRLSAEESLVVEDHIAYRRRTDKHRVEWAVYFAALITLVAVPYTVFTAVRPKGSTTVPSKKH